MTNPPRFDLRQIAFPHSVREYHDMPVIEVFFVTNRAELPGGQGGDFSNSSGEALAYGVAEVRIPAKFRMTDVQRPEIARGVVDDWSAAVLGVDTLTPAEFHSRLQARLAACGSANATLFVHGIQHSFDSAVRYGGALAFSLNLPQPMVVFAWPSDPNLSRAAYNRSREQVPQAARSLAEFLRSEGPQNFDIIGHSLGCKVVCRAIADIAQNRPVTEAPAPGKDVANLVLAAPDVEVADFSTAFLGYLAATARHTTVYVARNDHALFFSSLLNGGQRAGSGLGPDTAIEVLFDNDAGDTASLEIIDATFVNNVFTSHGYFVQNRAALADLQNLLRNDIPACQRQLLRHERAMHANYWIIPP
ncbi:MAG: alpha/beta hydrolase [Chthoniobacterales bacterium]